MSIICLGISTFSRTRVFVYLFQCVHAAADHSGQICVCGVALQPESEEHVRLRLGILSLDSLNPLRPPLHHHHQSHPHPVSHL